MLPKANSGNGAKTEVALTASLNATGVTSARTDTTVNPLSATKSVIPKTARTISELVGPMIDVEPSDTCDDLKEMREMVSSFNKRQKLIQVYNDV